MANQKKPWIEPKITRLESTAELRRALSYGPFGLVRPAGLGFLAGSLVFLVIRATMDTVDSPWSPADDLRLYAICAVGGLLLALVAGLIANFVIGKRIRDSVELQRGLFTNGELPPAFPRPDVPGYDLSPSAAATEAVPTRGERRATSR
jgi:hypothetical protein